VDHGLLGHNRADQEFRDALYMRFHKQTVQSQEELDTTASEDAVEDTATASGAVEQCVAQTHKMAAAITGSTADGERTSETTGLGTIGIADSGPSHMGQADSSAETTRLGTTGLDSAETTSNIFTAAGTDIIGYIELESSGDEDSAFLCTIYRRKVGYICNFLQGLLFGFLQFFFIILCNWYILGAYLMMMSF